MTQNISELPVEDLVGRFVKAQMKNQYAVREQNIPVANRQVDITMRTAEILIKSAKGRLALETLMSHSEPFVRLRAAQYVRRWAPDLAIPVLGRMLLDEYEDISVEESLEMIIGAKDSLYLHFGIRSFDWNDLIEPLKPYGIELPFWDRSKWS
ncbi:MAG: hypothetical protein JJ911_08585 [Rhizobiaceae bacterium]|nr:hypothetical protein [Rhizobiaceae bacterium]